MQKLKATIKCYILLEEVTLKSYIFCRRENIRKHFKSTVNRIQMYVGTFEYYIIMYQTFW